MPKVAEVVRITKEKGVAVDNTPNDLAEILTDPQKLADVAALVWLSSLEQAKAGGDKSRLFQNGAPGYQIEKSLSQTVTELWPSLPQNSDPANDPETFRIRQAIGGYLKYSHNMVCLRRGNRSQKSVWWVREDWSPDPPIYPARKTEMTPPARYADNGADTYRCAECPAEFLTVRSRSQHESAYADRPHPQGRMLCLLCPAVLSDVVSLKNHISNAHKGQASTSQVCGSCGRMFSDSGMRDEHTERHHSDRTRKTAVVEEIVKSDPATSLVEQIREAAESMVALVQDYESLTKENAGLREENRQLHDENAKYAKIKEAFRAINSE